MISQKIIHVNTLNNISSKGIEILTNKGCKINSGKNSEIIILRSKIMPTNDISDNLLIVARAGIGVNNIPVKQLSEKGIVVINTPGANALAVRELVFGSLICFYRKIIPASTMLNSRTIEEIESLKKAYCGTELNNKNLLVIGLGRIGAEVAKLAKSFGMHVSSFDTKFKQTSSLGALVVNADVISIHVPLTTNTKDIIHYDLLSLTKKKPVILNFSRPGIVNEPDIIKALDDNIISGYITDFPSKNLLNHSKILCLPHLGASTIEAEEQCAVIAANNSWRYVRYGSIINSVNFPELELEHKFNYRVCLIHKNTVNVLSDITSAFGAKGINIDELHNAAKEDLAYTVIDVSKAPCNKLINKLQAFKAIIKVRVLP